MIITKRCSARSARPARVHGGRVSRDSMMRARTPPAIIRRGRAKKDARRSRTSAARRRAQPRHTYTRASYACIERTDGRRQAPPFSLGLSVSRICRGESGSSWWGGGEGWTAMEITAVGRGAPRTMG